MELVLKWNSGACGTVLHLSDYYRYFGNLKINATPEKLNVVTGEFVDVLGVIDVKVRKEVSAKDYLLSATVINSNSNFVPLMGRVWMDVLFPN